MTLVDVPAVVAQVFEAVLADTPVKPYRKPPTDAAERTPFLVYQIASPTRVSNAAFRRGVRFTLSLNLVASNYPEASRLANLVIEKATDDIPRMKVPAGRLTHVTVTSGVVDARTSLGSSELEQVTMILSGIARKG